MTTPISADKDAACPRCGRHRPNGCLCHIPIPKFYTREDMAQAWDEGHKAGGNAALIAATGDDVPSPTNPYVISSDEGCA